MQKKFCDICEKPAIYECADIVYREPVGEEYSLYGDSSEFKRRCKITVRAVFGFEDHRAGFGGPPDLCGQCIDNLLEALRKQLD